jgi:hypothetical protein
MFGKEGDRSMKAMVALLVLIEIGLFGAYAQRTRGIKVVEVTDEKGQRFVAYDNSYAFIIGINRYEDSKIPTLNYAVQDANAIAQMLEGLEFPRENIRILLNENATLAKIKDEFAKLGRQTKKNDRLLVYWAGHGDSETSPRGGEIGYLIPHDAKLDSKYSTCLSMDEVKRMTELVAAKHILFLVDACYGGLSAVASRSLPKETEAYLQKITSAEAVQIITAGTKDEQVVESPSWGHSAFCKAILDGFQTRLADRDGNGVVTADELYSYLQARVFELSRSEHPKGHRPVFANLRSSEGQFAFVVAVPEFVFTISGLPEKNTVYLNGKKFAENKKRVSERLKQGSYNVEIEAEGRERFTTTLDLSSDRELTPAMKSSTIRYTLETNPPGATVKIDGADVGLSPVVTELTAGQHRVEIKKEGYETTVYTTMVTEQANFETKELRIQMFDVSVVSTPRGAQVFLNDLPQNQTPSTVQVRPGVKYTIELQWQGKKLSMAFQATGAGAVTANFDDGVINFSGSGTAIADRRETEKPQVQVTPAQPVEKKPAPSELPPQMAKLQISVEPNDAVITVDDKVVSAGLVEVEPGKRIIRITKTGFDSEEKTIDLMPGETRQVPIVLTKPSSTRWLWYVAGAAVVGGAAAFLLTKGKGTTAAQPDQYGSPPGFPINP